jgi:hypothetical protein
MNDYLPRHKMYIYYHFGTFQVCKPGFDRYHQNVASNWHYLQEECKQIPEIQKFIKEEVEKYPTAIFTGRTFDIPRTIADKAEWR